MLGSRKEMVHRTEVCRKREHRRFFFSGIGLKGCLNTDTLGLMKIDITSVGHIFPAYSEMVNFRTLRSNLRYGLHGDYPLQSCSALLGLW